MQKLPRLLRLTLPALTVVLVLGSLPSPAHAAPVAPPNHAWFRTMGFAQGNMVGVQADPSLRLANSTRVRTIQGKSFQYGRWISSWITSPKPFTELIPSWRAKTPAGTLIDISVRAKGAQGTSKWHRLSLWGTKMTPQRVGYSGRSDGIARAVTDTFRSSSGPLTQYQLKVRLNRRLGKSQTPVVKSVHVVTSRTPGVWTTSLPKGVNRVLDVPRYSQMIHAGENPEFGGGGEAWCSPTSLSMILGYYGRLPQPSSYSWVPENQQDRFVNYTASKVYDFGYQGAGNWAFNTGYASARPGIRAFVTRLNSLRNAEKFVAAGIPLAASLAWGPGELSGAPIRSSHGHLMVIVGFTKRGDVVVNDPAAASSTGVRRTYPRAQFERLWQAHSSGTVYVVHDDQHPLPAGNASSPW